MIGTAPPQTIFGHTFQPVTCAVISVLEQIDSRFLDMIDVIWELKDKPPEQIAEEITKRLKLSSSELTANAFVFVTPIDDLEKFLEDGGKEKLIKEAMATIGRMPPLEFGELHRKVMTHYIMSFDQSP